MKQIQKFGKTAAFGEDGKPVYMTDVKDIARFVKVPESVITKAMSQNIKTSKCITSRFPPLRNSQKK